MMFPSITACHIPTVYLPEVYTPAQNKKLSNQMTA
jgi:hypothetical protein